MKQGECEKCEGTGETHGPACLVRRLLFDRGKINIRPVTEKEAIDAAVKALEEFLKIHKKSDTKEE